MELILGSSSESRRKVLEQIGLRPKQISPEINEDELPNESPYDLVTRLGREKALAVSKIAPKSSIIISGDQVLSCDNKIFGKPLSSENAIKQLEFFSGKKATFFTNICVMNNNSKDIQSVTIPTELQFKNLSKQTICDYVTKEKPLKCAGSLKVEGLGITLISNISAVDLHAILGMPLMHLCIMLEKENFNTMGGESL